MTVLQTFGASILLASSVRESVGWTFEEALANGAVAALAMLAPNPLVRRLLAPTSALSNRVAVAMVLVSILSGTIALYAAMQAVHNTVTFHAAMLGGLLVTLVTGAAFSLCVGANRHRLDGR